LTNFWLNRDSGFVHYAKCASYTLKLPMSLPFPAVYAKHLHIRPLMVIRRKQLAPNLGQVFWASSWGKNSKMGERWQRDCTFFAVMELERTLGYEAQDAGCQRC